MRSDSSKYYKWEPEKGRGKFLNGVIEKYGYTVGAEIGTGHGVLGEFLLQSNPQLHLVQIGYYPKQKASGDSGLRAKKSWLSRINPYMNRITVIQQPSSKAASVIENETLDFVFIDGDHSYESVLEDIQLWYPKVREGGMVSGHDYDLTRKKLFGVIRAVRQYFKKDFKVAVDCVWYHFKKDSS